MNKDKWTIIDFTQERVREIEEDTETIETFEFTDEDGQNHCFVIECKFKVDKDVYVALLEVDPNIFNEEYDGGHDNPKAKEEPPNIILAKTVTEENGEVDIQIPTDEEFEKAQKVYESLEY